MMRALVATLLTAAALPAAPADPWIRIQSTHFELFTTASERAGRDLVRHFEQIQGFFAQVFKINMAGAKPVRIVAFRDAKEYQPYRPSEAAAAFFHDGSFSAYIVMGSADADHYPTATHEFAHLLIGQTGGTVPLWLNEGLAELYSTTEQVGGSTVVGKAPPGRAQALLTDRWIPLETIVTIGHDSPLYNEKLRAGMFYAESWALVHMLNLDQNYKPHLGVLLDALKSQDSPAAFEKAYGKTLAQVQDDLQEYCSRQYLHGVAFKIPLDQAVEAPQVELHAGMKARLALAELLADYPAKIPQATEMYGQLAAEFPQSWEVEASLGHFAWRERRNQEAVTHYERAVQLGGPEGHIDSHLYLDYARALLVTNRTEDAVAALRNGLRLDPGFKDAHYQLGLALTRTNSWSDAIAELKLSRPLKTQQAPRYFYAMAYSEFRLGDLVAARNYLEQGRPYTKVPEEVSALEQLSHSLGPPVVEGVLEEIECKGKAASVHVRVGETERAFLIPDLTQAKDLKCGPQNRTAVRIEFGAMPLGAEGADGIVRSLEFK